MCSNIILHLKLSKLPSRMRNYNKILTVIRSFSGAKFECTVGDLLEKWTNNLRRNNISEPKESVEHILAYILGSRNIYDVYKYKNKIISQEEVNTVEMMCNKRLKSVPIQYILKEWDFRGLTLIMSPPVFIPRPETEILVQVVLDEIVKQQQATNILDLCSGSGAISLALLKENSTIEVTAVDQSSKACLLIKENAQKHNLTERLSIHQNKISEDNLFFISKKYDIIVSNPPYIFSANMNNLQPEIKLYEDLRSLDGGEDGLKIIKLILRMSSNLLKTEGKLFLEVDSLHPEMIRNWIEHHQNYLGLIFLKSYKDFSNNDRFVKIIKI